MGTSETTPAEREGEMRKEIEHIRRFIRLGQNQVKHDELVLARLESELSALAPDAPWTPRVGDEVLIQARGIVREISDGFYSVLVPYSGYFKTPRGLEKPKCDMTTHTTNLLKEQEAALRPAPASGKLAASDCVEYLVSEAVKDGDMVRDYTRGRYVVRVMDGSRYNTERPPATPPVAVAGQVVVDSTDVVGYLTDLAQELEHQGDLSTANQMRKERDRLIVLPSVDDLPEWMTHFHHVTVCDYSRMSVQSFGRDNNQTLLEFAAALVAASRATAKEGNNG